MLLGWPGHLTLTRASFRFHQTSRHPRLRQLWTLGPLVSIGEPLMYDPGTEPGLGPVVEGVLWVGGVGCEFV